jgi:hypothetical protein
VSPRTQLQGATTERETGGHIWLAWGAPTRRRPPGSGSRRRSSSRNVLRARDGAPLAVPRPPSSSLAGPARPQRRVEEVVGFGVLVLAEDILIA